MLTGSSVYNMPGKLYITATPIGNLEDITIRGLNILKESDFIVCEDTRVTSILLKHYNISKELVSLNAATESRKIDGIIKRLAAGAIAALVSDAGTPCISDPGTRLVSEAGKHGIEICGIPGANAAITALSISGLPADSFIFEGFLPQKKGRQKLLMQLAKENRTIIFYESVHRIEKLLDELNEYMPNRYCMIFREITKKFEEVWKGTPSEIIKNPKTVKGEFVIILSPLKWEVRV